MCVAQHDRVDTGNVERERIAVALGVLAAALQQSAIEKNSEIPCLDEMTRTGHSSGGPEALNVHEGRGPLGGFAIDQRGYRFGISVRRVLIDLECDSTLNRLPQP